MGRRKFRQLIGRGATDRGIETAAPLCLSDHVPQGDSARGQTVEPLTIGKSRQIFTYGVAEQSPELVLGVRIIALGLKRGFARQASQDQKAGIR